MSLSDNFEEICARVRSLLNVQNEELFSRKRTANVVLCRQILMWYFKKAGASFEEVGDAFSRDHSTAIYSYYRVEQLLTFDDEVQGLIKKIKEVA